MQHITTTHCAGVQPDDRTLLVDEVQLASPKGLLVVLVCRRCWHISDDGGETWGTPCNFAPNWHPFTEDFILGGTHGVQICSSCNLVSADCGETWVKPAVLLPQDEVVLPVLSRAHQLMRTRIFRLRRPRAARLSARFAGL